MKKLLLIAATLLAFAGNANADPLTNQDWFAEFYLGRWCIEYQDGAIQKSGTNDKKCDGDYIDINHKGYSTQDDTCKYVSIRRTGELTPPATHSDRKQYSAKNLGGSVPVIRTVARCTGKDGSWTERRELSFIKGALSTEFLGKGK